MGRTKQLIPWETPEGVKPLVAASFDAIRPACGEVVVVLGHEADRVAAALAPRAFLRVNVDPDAEMFDSIARGLAAVGRRDAGARALVQPADHPEVRLDTLAVLLGASAASPDRAIIPRHAGRGGHPVLIPPGVARVIRGLNGPETAGGLRGFWKSRPDLCCRISVDDPDISRDLDVPADLER